MPETLYGCSRWLATRGIDLIYLMIGETTGVVAAFIQTLFPFCFLFFQSKGLGSTFRVCEMVIDPYGWTNEPKYTFHKVKVVPMYTAMNVDDKKTKL